MRTRGKGSKIRKKLWTSLMDAPEGAARARQIVYLIAAAAVKAVAVPPTLNILPALLAA